MSSFIAYTIFGLFSGAAYAIAASGLVLTYTTTRVFNVAHGAFGMLMAFLFWDFSVKQGMPAWLALILVAFVIAPLIGWFIARFVARGLGDSPVSVSLVVTVALLVALPRRRPVRLQARGAHDPAVLPRDELRHRRDDHHRAPADHDPGLGPGGARALPAAHQDPDRHRDAGLGRQPRAAQAVRRQARPGGGAVLGHRHLARRARRHPAGLHGRPRLLPADPARHQRVRRGDVRPAQEPPADVRRRHRARPGELLRPRLPPAGRADRPGRQRRAGAVPLRGRRGDAPGAAADRPGQGHRLRADPVAAQGARLGRGAPGRGRPGLGLGLGGQPAAGRHRRDVRDHDAVAGAAHRLRRPRLAGPVHVHGRRRADLRQARRAQPLRPVPLRTRSRPGSAPWSRCR